MIELYRDLEFKTCQDYLLSPGLYADRPAEPVPSQVLDLSVVTITDQAVFDSWLSRLEVAPLFAFDTETTSLNYMQAEIVGLSFAIVPVEADYVPLALLNPGLKVSSTAIGFSTR